MNANEIKVLNDKIERIQVQRTKAETKREVLMSRLESEISKYEKEYGVSLKGDTLKDTIKAISVEQKKVSKGIEEEYNLKSKVVSAIESSNIEEANTLLGIETPINDFDVEDIEDAEDLDEVSPVEDDTKDVPEEEDNFGIDEDEFSPDDDDAEDEDVFGLSETEEESSEKVKTPIGSSVDDTVKELDNDDDDEDIYSGLDNVDFDDFGFGSILNGTELDV
jgi:hypothetical protein